ncbi:hypothetical protein BOTBODRAFT_95821, partial [Botryobasidium botryosum FD-172 SS1]
KRVVLFSICMQSNQPRCNALQMVVGIFTHSCNTPERVIEIIAHAGLCVSAPSINNMVNSMSKKARDLTKASVRATLVSLGYNNLDVQFKSHQPTIEKRTKLIHMTTG